MQGYRRMTARNPFSEHPIAPHRARFANTKVVFLAMKKIPLQTIQRESEFIMNAAALPAGFNSYRSLVCNGGKSAQIPRDMVFSEKSSHVVRIGSNPYPLSSASASFFEKRHSANWTESPHRFLHRRERERR